LKDTEIIAAIRKGATERPIKFLYKEFPKIKSTIVSHGGDAEIAKEIFHDSLILLIEKVSDPSFTLTAKLSTFLFGINRFLWLNESRRRNKSIEIEWKDTLILTDADLSFNNEKEEELKLLETVLGQIGDRCRQLFELFYFKKQEMKTIAQTLNFSSVDSAKTQKYKCMEKAIGLAKEIKISSTNYELK
jgi:RNA polymerase sigma factor (sigma-70 family)